MRDIIKQKGLTQEEAADLLGITQGALSHYLIGRREIKASFIDNFCKTFNMEPGDLYDKEESKQNLAIPLNDLIEISEIIAVWLKRKGKKQDIGSIIKLAYAVYDEVKTRPREEWGCKIYSICDLLERVNAA